MRDSGHDVDIKWLPFQLRPNIPPEGHEKGGTPESRVGARIKSAGDAVGIKFTGKCDRYPNTLAAHALLKYADMTAPDKQNALQEILFRQYFTDGIYPSGDALSAAAAEAGLDAEAARAFAEKRENQLHVQNEAIANSQRGISGVPYFFVNGKPAFSGAQPPSAFTRLFSGVANTA